MLIAVLLVAPVRVHRECLATLLNRSRKVRVVATAQNASEAVEEAFSKKPNVALLDVAGDRGLALAEAIHRAAPETTVVALGAAQSEDEYLPWLEARVFCHVPPDASPSSLRQAIEAAAFGEALLPPQAAHALTQRVEVRGLRDLRRSLTPREREVAQLAASGLKNKQIASELCLEVSTVKTHVGNILRKLEIETRNQLHGWAPTAAPEESERLTHVPKSYS